MRTSQRAPQGDVEADQQLAEDEQHAQALGGDGTGHGAEDAHRGEAHDVVGDLEHDVDHFLHGAHQATRHLVVQVAQGDAEEDGEDEDLQDLVGGHGLEDVLREDVGDEVLEIEGAGLQVGAGRRVGQGHAQGGTRVEQVGEEQPEEQGAEGGADEPAQGLAADAADGLGVAHAGQTSYQGGEDQGSDDHLDQAQEDVGQDAEIAGDLLGLGRAASQRIARVADDDAEDQGKADPGGQAVHLHGCFLVWVIHSCRPPRPQGFPFLFARAVPGCVVL